MKSAYRDRWDAPAIPHELRALMARIGPVWGRDVAGHIACMTDEFSKLLSQRPDDSVRCTADIAYGPDPRHRLDVYRHPIAGTTAPALVFIHGGAFVKGHRNKTPQIYANVLRCFARHGIVGINVGYRLADAATYPGASLDVGAAVAWVRANAGPLGVDPARVFLMGHSAGGAHSASYAYNRAIQPPEGPGLAGLVLVSGRVRAETEPDNPNAAKVVAYYGKSRELHAAASAVSHVTADSVPTLVAWAEFENPLIDMHSAELVHALARARRRAPPLVWLRGHNHTSSVAHLGTAETILEEAIRDFIANPR